MLGKPGNDAAGEQLILRRRVHERVGLAGADHRQIVGARRGVRQQVRDPQPALAVLLEGPLGAEQFRLALDELALDLAELLGHAAGR